MNAEAWVKHLDVRIIAMLCLTLMGLGCLFIMGLSILMEHAGIAGTVKDVLLTISGAIGGMATGMGIQAAVKGPA